MVRRVAEYLRYQFKEYFRPWKKVLLICTPIAFYLAGEEILAYSLVCGFIIGYLIARHISK